MAVWLGSSAASPRRKWRWHARRGLAALDPSHTDPTNRPIQNPTARRLRTSHAAAPSPITANVEGSGTGARLVIVPENRVRVLGEAALPVTVRVAAGKSARLSEVGTVSEPITS